MRIGDTFMGRHQRLCGLAHITWPIVTLTWRITATTSASEWSGLAAMKTSTRKRTVRDRKNFRAPDRSGHDAGETLKQLT